MGQLERPGRQLEHRPAQGLDLGARVVGQRQRADTGPQVRLGLVQPNHGHALDTLHQQLDSRPRAGHLLDDGPRPDGVEIVGRRRLDLRVLEGHRQKRFFLGGQARFHRRHRCRPADGNGMNN